MEEIKYCMEFTNEEIFEFYTAPLREVHGILDAIVLDDNEKLLNSGSPEQIKYVVLDGKTENFSTHFYGYQVSIFISDAGPRPEMKFTFNEEFMFIDDLSRAKISSSDTYKNVVYEGNLRDKTHKEILDLLREITVLLIGAKAITIEEIVVVPVGGSARNYNYDISDFVTRIKNDTGEKKEAVFDNIKFIINGD